MRDNVSRLSYENWRDVVPDIDSATEEVESQSEQMGQEIDDAVSNLE